MFCTRCGNSAKDHERKFCTKCGLKLRPVDTSSIAVANTKEVNLDRKTTFGGRNRGFLESLVGRTIDQRYYLESPIGFGAMGAVYRAKRINIGDTAAIKILKPEHIADSRSVERFQREAQVGARLRHPNAVTVYDFGVSDENLIYFVMEMVDGDNLRTMLVKSGPLPQTTAVEIIAQVCEALEEAHGNNIVHRDLKPENIIVRNDADGLHVKVLDFGIASFQNVSFTKLTGSNGLIGTPHYMSPEQWQGEPVDQRSDIYSLGLILYEMLSGRAPLKQKDWSQPGLRETNPQISAEIEAVVMHALASDPNARPQGASELARELRAALRGYHPRMFEQQTVAEQRPAQKANPKPAAAAKRLSFAQLTIVFLLLAATATGGGLWWARKNAPVNAQTIAEADQLESQMVVAPPTPAPTPEVAVDVALSTPEPTAGPEDEVAPKLPTAKPSLKTTPKPVKRVVAPVKNKTERKPEPAKKQTTKEAASRQNDDRPPNRGPEFRGESRFGDGVHGYGDGMGWLRERWMRERAFRWGYRRGLQNAAESGSFDSRYRDDERARRRRWREEREEREKREK